MCPTLADAFASGLLLCPSPDKPDLVHLTRAVAQLSGVNSFPPLPATLQLIDLIGPADPLIFVLLDGLGMNLMRHLPASSFLMRNLKTTIYSTCPATTACALTSIATGQWPARHGITGWFTYVPKFHLTATILPFTERFTQRPLIERGITPNDILPVPAFYSQMTYRPLTLLPTKIVNTPYATYSRGGTTAVGYNSIPHAVDQIIAQVGAAADPAHVHLYVPDVDTACHIHGIHHPQVLALIQHIDAELARLRDALPPSARLVVTADHGLVDVAPANYMIVAHSDPLIDLLEVPFSGDARMPIFHLRPGAREAFIEQFQRRFGHNMILIDIAEAERLNFFGPEPLQPEAAARFGDFIAMPYRPATLHYHPPAPPPGSSRPPYLAQHGALTPDEMLVPVVVA